MNLFTGLWVALVTPFKNGQLDETALQNLVEDLAVRGVKGFVPLGTTGEAATLSEAERKRVIQLCLEAAGDCPVAPGSGTNSTAETIERVKLAKQMGCAGAMVITPYYNKPTQEGLYQHFKAVAESAHLPIMMYNVPGRTSVNMLPETVERLADIANIEAIKEACGNLEQISELCLRVDGRVTVLSGDDGLTLPILSVGGEGLVSVVGNYAPEPFAEMIDIYAKGNVSRALELHRLIVPLTKAMFLETNPQPIKFALSVEGKIQNEFRLPMVAVKKETQEKIMQAMKIYQQAAMSPAHV